MKKFLTLITCAALFGTSAAACGKKDRGDGLNHMFDASLVGNPKSLDPQYADDRSSNTVIKNLYSRLMGTDADGNIVCCNAESYTVSPDGLVYTFKLRRDNYWFFDENDDDIIDEGEYFPVTAADYEFALKRILDPKMKSPYADSFSCILNASGVLKGMGGLHALGVNALDDYTLAVTLEYPSAEFLSLMASNAASPCNESFFLSTKGRYGLDDRSVMSNGAFFVRQWFYDPYGTHNILYMKRNDPNAAEDMPVCPGYLSFSIERNEADVRDNLKNGDIECMSASSNTLSSKKYSSAEYSACTYGLVFNPSNTYFSNKNLRMALALDIDRETMLKSSDGYLKTAAGIVPPSVMLTGRSYRELASDKQFDRYDPETAKMLVQSAKNELGVASFETQKIMVCAERLASGDLRNISQRWHDELGIYIGIEDVSQAEFDRRIKDGEYNIALYPVEPRLGTLTSVMACFEEDECLKAASDGVKHSEEIRRSAEIPAFVESCAAAEKKILDEVGFIPLFYRTGYYIAKKDCEDVQYDPFTGALDFRSAKYYG